MFVFGALFVSLVVALAVIALFVGVLQAVGGEDSVEARLVTYAARQGASVSAERSGPRASAQLSKALAGRGFAAKLADDLSRANLKLTVPEYLLIYFGLVVLAFFLGLIISREVLGGLMLAVVGFILPRVYLKLRERNRLNQFNSQLTDMLTLLVTSLRAGYALLHSLEVVMHEMPAPISEEIGRVVREVGLGLSLPEALDHLVNRVHSDDLELIVTAINIQHEVGGNLASILETISQTIRDRVRLHGEIRSLTAQQTLTGYLLSLLPFIVGLILFLLSPKYMMRLLTPGPTLCIPIGAVISIGIGFFVMRKLTAIEA